MGSADTQAAYTMLAEGFRQSTEVPDVWHDRLDDEDASAVLDTAGKLIDISEWMPTIGQFVLHLNARKRQDAVRSPRGWRVARHCGRCDGSGWVEVDQPGSHIAVTACPTCDGTGKGNDLASRVTPPDEARPLLEKLRKALADHPPAKHVDEVLG